MKKFYFLFLYTIFLLPALAQLPPAPDKIYGQLFIDVQMNRIFADGKTFVDCVPKRKPADIIADYQKLKGTSFDLKKFVEDNFEVPSSPSDEYKSDSTEDVVSHIKNLWKVLRRDPDQIVEGSSLIALPYPYIVPGGRFREIYYWDSYFTMLGLKESGHVDMIGNMVNNFAFLINEYGFIPNGNRTYYLSRSQPPYFSLMVELLAESSGKQVYAIYLPALEKEYDYWMDRTVAKNHVVKMPDGSVLNRYYDQSDQPRQESYREDIEAARLSGRNQKIMYRHLRSGAESGWDFSSRWFSDGKKITTIQVYNFVPVDLNSLLYHLEIILSRAHKENGNLIRERYFLQLAERRKKAINKYCWSPTAGYYVDYNMLSKKPGTEITLGGVSPLFFNISPQSRIKSIVTALQKNLVHPGGVSATARRAGEQWDAPNGWAPLVWLTIKGLENYSQSSLARTIAERWIKLNVKVYRETGKLMEKYDVMDITRQAGGGEYPSQDGFGWTNGVLLKLISMYGMPKE